jgi:5-methylcytosine-specific restriction enzyme A
MHTRRDLHGTRTWYYTARWQRLRQRVCLEQAYACALCGYVTQQLEVDHVRKHEGDPVLFWDRANLQGLCTECHTRKTRQGQ